MSNKNTDDKQVPPRSVRLWADNDAWLHGFSAMYGGNINAALNIVIWKARGKGEYEIEEECKKYMRGKK